MYTALLARVVGAEQKRGSSSGGEGGNWLGALDDSLHAGLIHATLLFLRGDYSNGHSKLSKLSQEVGNAPSSSQAPVGLEYAVFAINRCRAVGYFSSSQHLLAIKALNQCVTKCPRWREKHSGGLADVLIMLSLCYEEVGKREEALHSARLAADVAQNRLEWEEKTGKARLVDIDADEDIHSIYHSSPLGPTLDAPTALTIAYHRLSKQLSIAGLDELAGEWLDRAVAAASKFRLDLSDILFSGADSDTPSSSAPRARARPPDLPRGQRDKERGTQAQPPAVIMATTATATATAADPSLRLSHISHVSHLTEMDASRSSGSLESPQPTTPHAREFGERDGLLEEQDEADNIDGRGRGRSVPSIELSAQVTNNDAPRRRARPRSALVSSPAASPFQRHQKSLSRQDTHPEREDSFDYSDPSINRGVLRPKSAVSKLGGGYDYLPPGPAVPRGRYSQSGDGIANMEYYVPEAAQVQGAPSASGVRGLVSALRSSAGRPSHSNASSDQALAQSKSQPLLSTRFLDDEDRNGLVPSIVDKQQGALLKAGGLRSLSFALPDQANGSSVSRSETVESLANAHRQGGLAVVLMRGRRGNKSAQPGGPKIPRSPHLDENQPLLAAEETKGRDRAARPGKDKERERERERERDREREREREKERERKEAKEAEAAKLRAVREARVAREAKEARERLELKQKAERENLEKQRDAALALAKKRDLEREKERERERQLAINQAAVMSAQTESLLKQLQQQREAAEEAIRQSEKWVQQEKRRLHAEQQRLLEHERSELQRAYKGMKEGLVREQRDRVLSAQYQVGMAVLVAPDSNEKGGSGEAHALCLSAEILRCRVDNMFDVRYKTEGKEEPPGVVEQYVHVRRLSPVTASPSDASPAASHALLETAFMFATSATQSGGDATPRAPPPQRLLCPSLRASNTLEMHSSMARILAQQKALSTSFALTRLRIYNSAATRVQALVRGVLVRRDKVLMRLLSRQRLLRQREQEVRSREMIAEIKEQQARVVLAQAKANTAPPPPLPLPLTESPIMALSALQHPGHLQDKDRTASTGPPALPAPSDELQEPQQLHYQYEDAYPESYNQEGLQDEGYLEGGYYNGAASPQLEDGVLTLMGNVSVLTGSVGNSLDNLDMIYMDDKGEGLGYGPEDDDDDDEDEAVPSVDLGEYSYSYGPATPLSQPRQQHYHYSDAHAADALGQQQFMRPSSLDDEAEAYPEPEPDNSSSPALCLTLSSNYPFTARVRPAAAGAGFTGMIRKRSLVLTASDKDKDKDKGGGSSGSGSGITYHPPGQGFLELFSVPLIDPSTCTDLTIVIESFCGQETNMRWEVHTRGEDVLVLLDNAHWSALSLGPLGQPDDHRVSVKCASLPIDALERLFVSAVDATAIPITTATTAVDFYSDPGGADDGGDSGAVSGVAAQVPHLSLTAPSTMSNTNTNGDEQKQHQAQAQAQPPTTAAAATGGAAAGLVVPHAPPRESGHSGHNMPMRPQEGQQARGGSAACAVS